MRRSCASTTARHITVYATLPFNSFSKSLPHGSYEPNSVNSRLTDDAMYTRVSTREPTCQLSRALNIQIPVQTRRSSSSLHSASTSRTISRSFSSTSTKLAASSALRLQEVRTPPSPDIPARAAQGSTSSNRPSAPHFSDSSSSGKKIARTYTSYLAKGKVSNRIMRETFERVVRSGGIQFLSPHSLIHGATNMLAVSSPTESTNEELAAATSTLRTVLDRLTTIEKDIRPRDVLTFECLKVHLLALDGQLEPAWRAARALLRQKPDHPPPQILLALLQSLLAHRRAHEPLGAIRPLLGQWSLSSAFLLQRDEGRFDHTTRVLMASIRRELFEELLLIRDIGEWYTARQSEYNTASYRALGEVLIHCCTTSGFPFRALAVYQIMRSLETPESAAPPASIAKVLRALTDYRAFDHASVIYADLRERVSEWINGMFFLSESLRFFAHKGDVLSVMDAMAAMEQNGLELRNDHLTWLMHVHAIQGNIPEVTEIFNRYFFVAPEDPISTPTLEASTVPTHPSTPSPPPTFIPPLPPNSVTDTPETTRPPPKPRLPTRAHFETIIAAHANGGDLEGANIWINKMTRARFTLSLRTFNDILLAFARRDDLQAVWAVMAQMKRSNIRPNAVTYTILIGLYGTRRDPINAERMYRQALELRVRPDQLMVNALMTAHVNAGSWRGVIRVFDWLRSEHNASESNFLWKDTNILNALLKAYVLVGAPFNTVMSVLRSYDTFGVLPNELTYILVVQSACDAQNTEAARVLIEEMAHTRQRVVHLRSAEAFALTLLMSAHLRDGDLDSARAVYDLMGERNVRPNALTFGIILRAYGNEGTEEALERAEKFLAELVRDGEGGGVEGVSESDMRWLADTRGKSRALEKVMLPVMRANGRLMRISSVESLFQEFTDLGGVPSLQSLQVLLEAYRKAGDTDACRQIWEQIFSIAVEKTRKQEIDLGALSTGSVPTDDSLTSTSELPPPDSTEGALNSMSERFQRSNLLCVPLSTYIFALSAAGAHDEIAHTWSKVKSHGFGFDSHNWNHLSIALVRAGQPERAFEVLEKVILPFQERVRGMIAQRTLEPPTPFSILPSEGVEDGIPADVEDTISEFSEQLELGQATPRRYRHELSQETRFFVQDEEFEVPSDISFDGGINPADLATPLHNFYQASPAWLLWKPHRLTIHILDLTLKQLAYGRPIRPRSPAADGQESRDEDSVDEAVDTFRRIQAQYPAAVQTIMDSRKRFKKLLRKGLSLNPKGL